MHSSQRTFLSWQKGKSRNNKVSVSSIFSSSKDGTEERFIIKGKISVVQDALSQEEGEKLQEKNEGSWVLKEIQGPGVKMKE